MYTVNFVYFAKCRGCFGRKHPASYSTEAGRVPTDHGSFCEDDGVHCIAYAMLEITSLLPIRAKVFRMWDLKSGHRINSNFHLPSNYNNKLRTGLLSQLNLCKLGL
jgi:hypothetical protein